MHAVQDGTLPIMPHDLDAEASVLGAILLDAGAVVRVAAVIEPADFYREANRLIYEAELGLHAAGRPIDNVTLAHELNARGHLDRVGGRAHLAMLQESVPTAANAEHYGRIIREKAEQRRLIEAGREAIKLGQGPALEPDRVLELTARIRGTVETPNAEADLTGDDWPAPLEPEAFHGLAGRTVRKIEPTTESDPAALLLQLLVFFGNSAGRAPHFVVEDTRHGLNEFVCLVGPTSKARKGTAERRVRKLFEAVAEDWLLKRVHGGLSTGEGFVWEVRDPTTDESGKVLDPGVADKRLLCVEGELASTLRRAEREGNSLSGELRLAWDGMPLGALTKARPARARDSHVSIVAHITREELTRYMTRTEAANGFGNRFLWVCVRRARELPFGAESPNLNAEVAELHAALDFAAGLKWPMTFDQSAAEAWAAVYGSLSAGKPGLVGAIVGRAEAHARRLAAVYAVLDQSPVIAEDHLFAALAVWDYCEASAVHIFGESLGDPDADEVLGLVRAAGAAGLSLNELHEALQHNWPSDRKARALRSLKQHGLIREEKGATSGKGGRPPTRYVAVEAHERATSYLTLAKKAMGYEINANDAETSAGADSEFGNGPGGPQRGYAETPDGGRS